MSDAADHRLCMVRRNTRNRVPPSFPGRSGLGAAPLPAALCATPPRLGWERGICLVWVDTVLDTAAWIPPQCWYAKRGAQGGTHGNGHFSDAYPALRADHIGGRPIPVLMAKTLSFFLCSLQARYEACVCGLGRPYLDLYELWNWMIALENFTCTRSQTRCVFSVDILCERPAHQAEPSALRLQQRVPKATAVQNSPTR